MVHRGSEKRADGLAENSGACDAGARGAEQNVCFGGEKRP